MQNLDPGLRIGLEVADGSRLLVRMPGGELRLASPHLLTLPGRSEAEADPVGSPRSSPGGPVRVRAVRAAAAAIRPEIGTDTLVSLLLAFVPSRVALLVTALLMAPD